MFTKEQLAEILAVCHKATPGPWYTEKTGANFRGFSTECIIATVGGNSKVYANPSEGHIFPADDKDFIALARTALPQLAEEVIKLREKYEQPNPKCNKGHENTLPLALWDCPMCTEELTEENAKLRAVVEAARVACEELEGHGLYAISRLWEALTIAGYGGEE